jgi:hypothetical protein
MGRLKSLICGSYQKFEQNSNYDMEENEIRPKHPNKKNYNTYQCEECGHQGKVKVGQGLKLLICILYQFEQNILHTKEAKEALFACPDVCF